MKTQKINLYSIITICLTSILILYLFLFAETYLPFIMFMAIVITGYLNTGTKTSKEI